MAKTEAKTEKKKPSLVEAAMKLGAEIDASPVKVPRYSTGSLVLDDYLGGGLPYGEVTEIWGGNNSGKTTTALIITAVVTQARGKVAYFNVERQRTLREWGTRIGVDWNYVDEITAETAEQYAELILVAIRSGEYDLIVIDSLAMMSPKAEVEIDLQDKSQAQMGLSAKLFTMVMRLMTAAMLGNDRTHVLILNQMRNSLSAYKPDDSPGGHAVHHKPVFRLRTFKIEEDWADGEKSKMDLRQIGIRMAMVKSKATNFKGGIVSMPVVFLPNGDVRVDAIDEIFTFAKRFGLFTNAKGAKWTGGNGNVLYQGEVLGNGETAARAGLRSNATAFESIYKEVMDIINGRTTRQPAQDSDGADLGVEEPEYDGDFAATPELALF